jgi:peptidyl-prolyl cis-trans isomerase SurA
MFRTILLLFLTGALSAPAQQVLDKVIGVVGKYPVLMSDLQSAMLEREETGPVDRCRIFEMLVYQKLLVAQADRDSITVTDQEVETELSRRMAYFINKFGSEEKLEKFYGKRTNVLKDDFRPEVTEQLLADRMGSRITGDTKITPAEVRQFFNAIPADSLPLINSEVELQHLVKKPTYSAAEKKEARDRLAGYRERIIKGQSTFSTLARLYSDDPESAKAGGEINNVARGQMVPEFESVAFRLKNGEVSEIFESVYGFHLLEMRQRKGELLDLRHMLVMPRLSVEDFNKSKSQLDSIYSAVKDGSISFEDAVKRFSDDKETKQNGGLLVNPQTVSTKFDNEILSRMDPNLISILNNMQPGDLSRPTEFYTQEGIRAFRIIKLKNRIDPHRANLKDDYQRLAAMANGLRNQKAIKEWIRSRSKTVYIKLDPEFACKFENDWSISN